MQLTKREGTVSWDVPGLGKCQTWYRVFGDINKGRTPLVVLHGGPGASHEYMLPMVDLHYDHGIPVVFYDQIGNGRSTRLKEKAGDVNFWTVALFLDELNNLLDHLKLREFGFDLYGHSWGAMFGSEFAALRPEGIRRLILASGPASIDVWMKGLGHLRAQLPKHVQDVLDKGDRDGDFESPEYEAATDVFFRRHLCRLDPWPKEVDVALQSMTDDPTVRENMYGISELVVTGSLKNWSAVDKLSNIRASTLLVNGSYDEAQDVCMQPFFDHISQVKWIVLDNCSHFAHVEERKRYMDIVAGFLR